MTVFSGGVRIRSLEIALTHVKQQTYQHQKELMDLYSDYEVSSVSRRKDPSMVATDKLILCQTPQPYSTVQPDEVVNHFVNMMDKSEVNRTGDFESIEVTITAST